MGWLDDIGSAIIDNPVVHAIDVAAHVNPITGFADTIANKIVDTLPHGPGTPESKANLEKFRAAQARAEAEAKPIRDAIISKTLSTIGGDHKELSLDPDRSRGKTGLQNSDTVKHKGLIAKIIEAIFGSRG